MMLGLVVAVAPAPVVEAAYDLNTALTNLNGEGGTTQQPLFNCDDLTPEPIGTGRSQTWVDGTRTIQQYVELDTKVECKPVVPSVVNVMMYIVGIISVIVLIVGGILYATSTGDEAKVKKAKGAIVAALVGLVFAVLAWTLVNFVFTAIK
jgi:hypothetical protein